ncbi:MAG: 2-hydroxy-acid oxidase, partial [Meiothermus sp.]
MKPLAPLLERLSRRKVLTDLPQRQLYRYDAIAVGETPAAVVLPETTQDVVEVVRFAKAAGLPVVARGAASGLSGGAVPVRESLVVAFTKMTRLELDPIRRIAIAQPGVVTAWISER